MAMIEGYEGAVEQMIRASEAVVHRRMVLNMDDAGYKGALIARAVGITPQRVSQILKEEGRTDG